ncbi:hypothetical protein KEM52_004037, partial [Ascosphaera acerosa]
SATLAPPPSLPPLSLLRHSGGFSPFWPTGASAGASAASASVSGSGSDDDRDADGSDARSRASTATPTKTAQSQSQSQSGAGAGAGTTASAARRNFSRPLSRGSAITIPPRIDSLRRNSDSTATRPDSLDRTQTPQHQQQQAPRQMQRTHRPPPLSLIGRYHSENNVATRLSVLAHGPPPASEASASASASTSTSTAKSPSQLPRGRQPPRNSAVFGPALNLGLFSPPPPAPPPAQPAQPAQPTQSAVQSHPPSLALLRSSMPGADASDYFGLGLGLGSSSSSTDVSGSNKENQPPALGQADAPTTLSPPPAQSYHHRASSISRDDDAAAAAPASSPPSATTFPHLRADAHSRYSSSAELRAAQLVL